MHSIKLMKTALSIKLWVIAISIVFSLPLSAQVGRKDHKVSFVEEDKYISGYGEGETLEEADKNAWQNLISQISVNVESSFSSVEQEVNKDGDLSSHTVVENVVRTYSSVSGLKNAEQHILTSIGVTPVKVVRYVERTEIAEMFNARAKKMGNCLSIAKKAESESNLDVALRYYYWAYCLLRTIPNYNQLTNEEDGVLLTIWIPNAINDIFRDIKVEKRKKAYNTVYLDIKYKGQPVSRLDYTCLKKNYTATDGDGYVDLASGASGANLSITCEYKFKDEIHQDPDIENAVKLMKDNDFPQATIRVADKPKVQIDEEDVPISFFEKALEMRYETPIDLLIKEEDVEPFANTMSAVVKCIKARNYDGASKYFTERGYEMFGKLMKLGNARLIDSDSDLTYFRYGKEVMCRSLKMSFAFKTNNRNFVENVNFTFNNEGLIDCIAFGLGDKASSDILLHKTYSQSARIVMTCFLENYKTAYALKDIDYIRSVFDDDAIIISGTVLEREKSYRNPEKKNYFLNEKETSYRHYSKEGYMQHLSECFDSNEFVNICFADTKIRKGNESLGETYSITIKQDYYSSNYGDTGYLMLIVDFNKPSRPLIKIKTWSPNEDDFKPGMW